MNHSNTYEKIIKNSQFKNRKKLKKTSINYVYYENHHIIPKCLGGTNNEENLVLLTAREHYICHKLLTFIYKGNKKIANSFCRMTWDKNGNRNISSYNYSYAKELKALIPMSEDTLNKMRKPHGPMSEKHKSNLSKASKGRKISDETKLKMSLAGKGKPKIKLKGKIPWNKGIPMSDVTKQKIIKSNLGVSRNKGNKLSEETKEKIKLSLMGKKQSKETIEKRKKSIGEPWNKGKKLISHRLE